MIRRILHFFDSWLGGGPPTGWFGPAPMPANPRTFDIRRRYWGHSYSFKTNEDGTLNISGHHTPRPAVGDYILLEDESCKAIPAGEKLPIDVGVRYQMIEVEHPSNVRDMFIGTARFAPRVTDEDFETPTYEQLDTSPYV